MAERMIKNVTCDCHSSFINTLYALIETYINLYVNITLSEAIGSLSRRCNSSDGSVLVRRLTKV